MTKAKQKPKRTSQRRSQLMKSVFNDNIRPELGISMSMVYIPIETSLLGELKVLASRHQTAVSREIHHAIEAYVLNSSPADVRLMNALLDRFHTTMDKNSQAIDKVLHEISQNNARVRKARVRSRSQ